MYTLLIGSSFKEFNSLVASAIAEAMHWVNSCNANWHSMINYNGNKFVYHIAKCSKSPIWKRQLYIYIYHIYFQEKYYGISPQCCYNKKRKFRTVTRPMFEK